MKKNSKLNEKVERIQEEYFDKYKTQMLLFRDQSLVPHRFVTPKGFIFTTKKDIIQEKFDELLKPLLEKYGDFQHNSEYWAIADKISHDLIGEYLKMEIFSVSKFANQENWLDIESKYGKFGERIAVKKEYDYANWIFTG